MLKKLTIKDWMLMLVLTAVACFTCVFLLFKINLWQGDMESLSLSPGAIWLNYRLVPAVKSFDDALQDWKTYINDQYGFEFRYPQEWNIPILNNETVELGCPKEDFEGELKCPLTFNVLPPISRTKFLKTLELTPFKYGEKLINWDGPEIENLNLGTTEAISYRSVGMCNYTNSVYFGKKNTIEFQDNCEKYLNNGIYKQIASTFKFAPAPSGSGQTK